MTRADAINRILRILHDHDSFVITSHARPDGDAIGSALALMHLLRPQGKQVTVAFADRIPTMYRCLPGIERIVPDQPLEVPEVAILLECDSIERTGFQQIDAGMLVNIDHHQSGRSFADFNWIDSTACAVGTMIYDLVIASGEEITPEMASCLYAALLTDTGAFTFASTSATTFAVAGHLLERGADSNSITQAIYFSNAESKLRLLGSALSNLEIDGEVAWTFVTGEDMDRASASVEDCEGIVNYLISILGVRAAVFLRELPSGGRFRLNLRSKGGVDVAEVAERFGGGGHRNASGCTIDGPLAEAIAVLVGELHLACRSACATLLA
jgi:phosphoesterase RecJ-like protein